MATRVADGLEQAASDKALVQPIVRTFFKMAVVWDLGEQEQCRLLGGISRRTLYAWRNTPPSSVTPDVMRRLSYLVGIHGLLRQLFPDTPLKQMATRVRQVPPTALTDGRPLLEYILEGGLVAMYEVRSYLVSEAGSELVAPRDDQSPTMRSRPTASSR
jgi:hypothetical protein